MLEVRFVPLFKFGFWILIPRLFVFKPTLIPGFGFNVLLDYPVGALGDSGKLFCLCSKFFLPNVGAAKEDLLLSSKLLKSSSSSVLRSLSPPPLYNLFVLFEGDGICGATDGTGLMAYTLWSYAELFVVKGTGMFLSLLASTVLYLDRRNLNTLMTITLSTTESR